MDNELKILKMYLTIKNEVETVIKSFKFNLNLISDINQLNKMKLYNLILSLSKTSEILEMELHNFFDQLTNLN